MKCPNCESENIQFCTSTSSKGFSTGDACCGTILLGPLGLLCGVLGAETSTEEFWICHDCGHRFSTGAAQRHLEKELESKRNEAELLQKYNNYKASLEKENILEANYEEIITKYTNIVQQQKIIFSEMSQALESAKKSNQSETKNTAQQITHQKNLLLLGLGLTVGGFALAILLNSGFLFLVMALGIYFLWKVCKADNTYENKLSELDSNYGNARQEYMSLIEEEKRFKRLYDQVNFIQNYEKTHGKPENK